uniref:Uncharacterized protein n=1 Tax=Mus musculus TaxID=10090 RepID=Q3URX1_MOUSE|nr:unnamed protein product [Mus musculus]
MYFSILVRFIFNQAKLKRYLFTIFVIRLNLNNGNYFVRLFSGLQMKINLLPTYLHTHTHTHTHTHRHNLSSIYNDHLYIYHLCLSIYLFIYIGVIKQKLTLQF